MPIRLSSCSVSGRTVTGAQASHCRTFHVTAFLYAQGTHSNHYETLGVSPSCAQSDIKKAFYQLSKKHHPDRNLQNREEASQKFTAISEAYSILGDPDKRAKWDRENLPSDSSSSVRRSGSFSSASGYSGPGGRKATGLSKRRGQFRGPPPSFYRQGGWGNQTAREQQANSQENAAWSNARGQAGSDGQQQQGSYPFGSDPNDVPHFNREGHYRTQNSLAEQLKKGRQQRRKSVGRDGEETFFTDEGPGEVIGRFFMVGGLLVVAIGGPLLAIGARN